MRNRSPNAWLDRVPRSAAIAALVVAVVLAVLLLWANYVALAEAFGDGPPYYGRTTNMDKWSNPVPRLLVIDVIGLMILAGLAYLGIGRIRR